MKNKLHLPSLFPLKKELNSLVEQLFSFFKPELIYLSEIRKEPTLLCVVHLLLPPKKKLTQEDVGALNNLKPKFPYFLIQWSTVNQLRTALQQGSLYYLRHCYFGKVIYPKDNQHTTLQLTSSKGTTLINTASDNQHKDFNALTALFCTAYDQSKKGNYDKAAVNLTAILVQLFNTMETLFQRTPMSCDSLRTHVDNIARFSPEIDRLFNSGEENIEKQLVLMENIFSRGLDKPVDSISRDQLLEVFAILETVFKIVHDTTAGILEQCSDLEKQLNPPKQPILVGDNLYQPLDEVLHQALDFLRSEYRVHSLFLINKQQQTVFTANALKKGKSDQHHTFTCTVLLITYTPISINPAQLMDRVFNHSSKIIKMFFLLETLSKVLAKLDFGNNFLSRALSQEHRIFQEDDQLQNHNRQSPYYHPVKWQHLKDQWEARINRANYLAGTIDSQGFNEDPVAFFFLVEAILIQVCIGMVNVFWEYRPSYTALPYLLHLCGDFTNFPKEMLRNSSFQSQRMYHLLTQSQLHMRYGCPYNITEDDKDKAHRLCDQFLTEAERITSRQLDLLKMKAFQRDRPFYVKS